MNPVQDRELYYREHQEYIDNNCMNYPLTLNFLRENRDRIDWILTLEQMYLPAYFLEEMKEHIPLYGITLKAYKNLPESFILRYWYIMKYAFEIIEGIKYGHIKAPSYD